MRYTFLVAVCFLFVVPVNLSSTSLPPDMKALSMAKYQDLLEDAYRMDLRIEETLKPSESEVEAMTAYELYSYNPKFVKLKNLAKQDIIQLVVKVSEIEEINPAIVLAIIHQESGFNPVARSHKGAIGLMQLMPGTAAELGVDPTNPVENVIGGIRYYKKMRAKFQGYTTLGLAAYNAGPTAVRRHDGIPPYDETQEYVKKVYTFYHRYNKEKSV